MICLRRHVTCYRNFVRILARCASPSEFATRINAFAYFRNGKPRKERRRVRPGCKIFHTNRRGCTPRHYVVCISVIRTSTFGKPANENVEEHIRAVHFPSVCANRVRILMNSIKPPYLGFILIDTHYARSRN